MSFAAAIPAILQIASGIASGLGAMEQNAANKRTKGFLENEAAKLARLSAPLGRALVAGYQPDGELSRILETRETAEAARNLAAAREDGVRNAWRYGGPGYGRAAGFLSAAPYAYIVQAQAGRAAGRTRADDILADLYLAAKDHVASEKTDAGANWNLAGDIFRDFGSVNYGR